VWTENWHARGRLTVQIYQTFKVQIIDAALCKTILSAGQRYSNQELGMLTLKDSQNGSRGRANTVLTLPLCMVTESYLALPPERCYRKSVIENQELDESVLAILGDVDVPQYQRV